MKEADLVSQVIMCLYHVGVVGIKISSLDTFIWSHIDQSRITKGEVKRSNQIKVHKMLLHSLEIRDKNINKSSDNRKKGLAV